MMMRKGEPMAVIVGIVDYFRAMCLVTVLGLLLATPVLASETVVRMDWELIIHPDGMVHVIQVANVTVAAPDEILSDIIFTVPWDVDDEGLIAFDHTAASAVPVVIEPLPSGNVAILSLDSPLVYGEHRVLWIEYDTVQPTTKQGASWTFSTTIPVVGGSTVVVSLPEGAAMESVTSDTPPTRISDINGSLSVRWDELEGDRFAIGLGYMTRVRDEPLVPVPSNTPTTPHATTPPTGTSRPVASSAAVPSITSWTPVPYELVLFVAALFILIIVPRVWRAGGPLQRVYSILNERERLIVDLLWEETGPLSQVTIGRRTGLSTSTVSNIARELEIRGILERIKEGKHVRVTLAREYRR
jgi:uncharacterized membrane protein